MNNSQMMFKEMANGKDIDSDLTKQETPGRKLSFDKKLSTSMVLH